MTFPRACAFSLLFLWLSTSVPVAREATRLEGLLASQVVEPCVRTQGYWRTHYSDWPITAMALGDPAFSAHQYSANQLLSLLETTAKGDASIILATQLIAAKLNVANGANPAPVAAALARADALLAAIRRALPYGIKSNTPVGVDMVATAAILEAYNKGQLPGSCGTANTAPVANAGPDQNVELGVLVTLDGSASSDADGNQLRFEWTFLSRPPGSLAELTNPAGVRPTFVADEPGTYLVQLLVYDGVAASEAAMVRISTENVRPVANAGADQTAPVTATVHLDGTASTDVDGNPLSFAWQIVQRPAASQAELQNPTAVDPALTIDAAGEYIVELVVSDGSLDSPPDTVRLSTSNSAPVANAGPDATGVNGATITLDGSGSTDVDGDGLTYHWTLSTVPPGSAAVLAGANTVSPSFVIDISGEYVAQLVVNDGTIDSGADTVAITTLNTRPVANAGADQAPAFGQVVELDGSGSTDVDGDELTYLWSLTTVPPGSVAALSDATAVRPTLTPDVAGLYVAQLMVRDASSASDPDTVTVFITDEPVNQPPVAEAGLPKTVAIGETVGLDGSQSSDPNGDALTYRWSVTPPPGSAAVLSNAFVAQPTFAADVFGDYVAQLIVNDGHVDSAPDTVTISTLNSAPVANAGSDQTASPGDVVILDGGASFEPDLMPLTFTWSLTRPAGSAAVLSSTSESGPSFTVDVEGVYVAQLIVSDGVLSSQPDTVAIIVGDAADLGLDYFFAPTSPGTGTPSNWGISLQSGTATPVDVEVSIPVPSGYVFVEATADAGTYNPVTGIWSIPGMVSFTSLVLRLQPEAAGDHTIRASVLSSTLPDPNPDNDQLTLVVTPTSNVDVRPSFFNFQVGTRTPGDEIIIRVDVQNWVGPAAADNVAVEFRIPAGFTLIRDEAQMGSYDSATGVWTIGRLQPFGLARNTFHLRLNALGPIDLRLAVTTTSNDINLADNVIVIPRNNRIPIANAGADRAVSTQALVTLDGTASFDADGDPITFEWVPVVRPINSDGTFAGPTTPTPSFTPTLPGNYVSRLIVRDDRGTASVADTVTIAAAITNTAPAFVSTPITSAFTGQLYSYDVNAADVDPLDVLQFSLPTAPTGMSIDPQTGLIQWLPDATQDGAHPVVVRVQDAGGFAATQSFTIQVSSPSNSAPVAADDDYSVRLGESLSVPAPGVTGNDADASPLSARLTSQPGNGTLLFGADGSFTYTPHTMQPGEFVMAENINLASRMPGVSMVGGGCPQCAIDENINTEWNSAAQTLVLTFPSDVRVSRVDVINSRNVHKPKVTAGRLVLESSAGATLFDTGNVEFQPPDLDARFVVPDVQGVRRARFIPDPTSAFSSAIAEFRVIGSGLIQRVPFVEPNLLQLLPATVQASSIAGPHVAESIADDNSSTNWFTSASAGEFIEVTFPAPVTVRRLIAANPNGRPDGFGTSITMSCSGTFTLLDANRGVLHDTGLVNEPTGFLNPSYTVTLDFPDVAGVRHIRYTSSGCTAGFGLGFADWQVLGTAPVSAPALSMSEKQQSLQGREAHSTPIVINLTDDNGDGSIDANDVPDIAVPVEATGNQLRGEIMVVSGDDGRLLFTAGGPDLVSPWSELAAGDIDADGRPEILAVSADGNRLLAFEHDGTMKWQSATNTMPSFVIGSSTVRTGAVSIANLDGTGRPEIIVGASVFDADGNLLGDGRAIAGTTGGTGMRSAISAVADIDLDGAAELVAGPTAYRLSNGALMRVWRRTDRADGYVGIANLDDDPQAEIVTVANGTVYALNHDGSDFQPWNAPSHAPVAIPGGGQGGPPLIVDVDGDGRPEIGVAGSASFVIFNRDGSVRWKASISDRSSNSTGAVAFDLNGDGEVEIIYRDERFLRVYRGADGVLLMKTPVGSATWSEEPVVADVDNDGHADIIVSSDLFAQSAGDTGLLVFQDIANRWTRTRRIWNQHAYHITNVDENGGIPASESAHWLTPGLNAFRTNAFVAGESADATDSFTYIASDGSLESNTATVRISLRAPNAPPTFTSQPIGTAAPAVFYSYAAQADDPDSGDILSFSLASAPEGMSIDPGNGLIEWTPSAGQTGPHTVVVKVADLRGLFALQSFTIAVSAPLTVPAIEGQPGAAANTVITAAGFSVGDVTSRHSALVAEGAVISQHPPAGTLAAAGSPVNYVLSQGPPPVGVVPDVVGLTQNDATSQVSAAGFSSALSLQSSSVVPLGRVLSQNPAAGQTAPAGSSVGLVLSSGPPPGEIDLDGDGFTGDQGDCRDDDPLINPNALDIPGDGIDQNCNGVDSIAGDFTAPTASLVSPNDLSEITTPTDIVGTVSDANFLRYSVQLSEVDATTFTVIGSGTTAVTAGVVGRLDPTLLENGLYRVRLIAEDVNGQTAIDERVYRIDGAAKVGLFSLTFVDLRVPVSGIPITIERTYDSRVKTQRDFGVGWSLVVKAGRVQHNRPTGQGWLLTDNGGPFDLPCTVTNELRAHITEVRLSDRESYQFRPVLRDVAALGGGCTGTVKYELAGGTALGATLTILDGDDFLFTPGDNNLFYIDGSLNTGLLFNPRRLRLTTVDGRVVDLERGIGVTRAQDNNGNALTISDSGIVHSSGKSVAFTRDARGRLVRITDPRGNTLEYGYTGDDLTTFTDQEQNVTTFTYDEDHNLLTIVDPLGNRAVLSEYDADGRLIAVTDARGGRTEFTHDVEGREELVIDALGRTSRVVYDDRGNLTLQEKAITIDGATVVARTSFQHDAAGNETEVIDADGLKIQGAYDGLNLLEEVVDPDGLALRTLRTYDARGEVLTQTDPTGTSMAFAYDLRGNLTVLTDGTGSQSRVTYDAGGRPTSSTDALGRVRRLAFDASGRVLSEEQLDANGVVVERTSYSYDANGNRLTRTELRFVNGVPAPATTSFAYDGHNRLIATTDALGGMTRIEYNAVGLESARINQLGRRTEFSYDEVGALIRTDFPDGTFESHEYDEVGNLTSTRDRGGRTSTFEHDELKRQVRSVRPDGSAVRTIYSAAGRVLATIDARGNRTDHEYDAAGRRLRIRQPAVVDATTGTERRPETVYAYDDAGKISSIIDPNGRQTSFEYDGMGRVVRRTAADGTTREFVYDDAGQLVEQRDESGRRTVSAYNGAGRVTSVTDALNGVTSYTYDGAGVLQSQTDALGRTTRFLRDALGRVTTRRLPGGGVETFAYDAAGNTLAHTDFNGATVRFTYDDMNRMTRRRYPDGLEHSFSYTPVGQRSSATDARGTTAYAYDVNHRLTRVDHPGGEAVEYAYDLDGNIRRVDTGAGVVDYTRDALSRITGLDAVLSGMPLGSVNFGYDAAGNLMQQRRPNDVITRIEYDLRNRVTRVVNEHNGATLGSFDYQLSPTGRRTRVNEPGGAVVRYGYDALERLVSEVRDGVYSVAYEYDAVGNRVRVNRNGTVSTYAFDVDDRLLSGGGATFTYDANGDLQSRTFGGQTTSYEWNADGQLVRTAGSGGSAQFSYDVDGRRVARQAGGATTNYLVDAMNPSGLSQVLEERDGSGNVVTQYVHGSNLVAARRAAGASFYHGDALGSTRLLTDAAGAVTDQYDYDAFGNRLTTGPTANAFQFAGQEFEPAGGLYYMRARYYEPTSGRFLGRDPFPGRLSDPRSMHPYLYAHADPVNVTDPTGLFSLIELATGENIQGILRGLEFASSSIARYCATTGKIEVAQEALFWGQFVAAGPVLANELFGTTKPNFAVEVTIEAKRFLNVFNTPEKIVEAKVSFEADREGGRKLGAEFTRQDGFQFGGAIDFANPSKSKFKVQGGLMTLEAGSLSESSIGLKKTIPIFETERCNIEIVKGNLEIAAKVGPKGASVEAAFVLESPVAKFTYPFISLP